MLYSRFKLRLSSSVKLLLYYARLVKRHATLNIMGIDMARRILESSHIHPNIQAIIENSHGDIIEQVQSAVTNNNVVVVGMAQNPAPKRARKVLNDNNIDHVYLEYGSYFKEWRRRNALKMWTGWPTFPMVFVKGTLIGGSSDLRALIDSGEITSLLAKE
jgi:monothiol glutaredoxin